MVNPFTIQSRISKLQQEVLAPLYTMHQEQEQMEFDWLLVLTGRIIEANRSFLEEIASSKLVAAAFKIVKMLGGAPSLTSDDFDRFTRYINDGGIRAMTRMLLAADKEQTFKQELQHLPAQVKNNAPLMLSKAVVLHQEFIRHYFREQYGSEAKTPDKLTDNFQKATLFIQRLADLARQQKG